MIILKCVVIYIKNIKVLFKISFVGCRKTWRTRVSIFTSSFDGDNDRMIGDCACKILRRYASHKPTHTKRYLFYKLRT